ncbi:Bug family tripartite tricarboxylate transporter substrate binding protein [Roseomonas sp. USHLN139]|uniref:Bug family tripartite tricarboxylate transporter substrate binding protein n=1 Tax=Roseomonas sp. USHLN139 TaxID=3081298 RepID=UPI003B019B5E
MLTRRRLGATALAGVLAAPAISRADDAWPAARPIEVIVPYPPAGGIDLMARLAVKYLPKHLPQARFVVTNRPGAGGQTGNEAIFSARPDGFTIGAIASLALSSIPLERRVRWNIAEYSYIANAVDDPGAFWVRADSPIKDLADLRARAAAKPEAVSIGTAAGIGSDDHQLLLAFEEATGVKALNSPYNGTAPCIRDLLGGQIDAASYNNSEGLALLREGRTRCLGQAAPARWQAMADVPTFREQGMDVLGGSARGFIAPPGLPQPVLDQLVAGFGKLLADPEFLAEAQTLNLPLRPIIGDDYRKFVLAEAETVKGLFARRPWSHG